MMFLLDTNILSELRRGRRCNPGVADWFAAVAAADLCISALTIGELHKGIALARQRRDYTQADNLDAWLRLLSSQFDDHILLVDTAVAQAWGQMYAIRNVPVVDGLLAATAKVNNLTLVTRNIADVHGLGADLLNPFS